MVSRIGARAWLGLLLCAACAAPCCGAVEPENRAVSHPYPLGDQGDLWLMAGQSNMGGYALMKQETQPDPRILFFAAQDDRWVVARDPVHNLFFRGQAFIPKEAAGAEAAVRKT
jgi:hypothetical protein